MLRIKTDNSKWIFRNIFIPSYCLPFSFYSNLCPLIFTYTTGKRGKPQIKRPSFSSSSFLHSVSPTKSPVISKSRHSLHGVSASTCQQSDTTEHHHSQLSWNGNYHHNLFTVKAFSARFYVGGPEWIICIQTQVWDWFVQNINVGGTCNFNMRFSAQEIFCKCHISNATILNISDIHLSGAFTI